MEKEFEDDYQELYDVSDWQIELVRTRVIEYKKNPNQVIDFNLGMDDIEKDL